MKINNLKLTIITCTVLIILQTMFIYVPPDFISLYSLTIRPLTFAILAVAIHVLIDRDIRAIPHANLFNKLTIIFALLFGFSMLLLAFNVGVAHNSMVTSQSIVLRNIWERALLIIIGDLIRYKLIKTADEDEHYFIIFILTLSLVYSQTTEIHRIVHGNMSLLNAFFELIFSPLVTSFVVSYFAIKGTFLLVTSVSFLYTITPYLIPILPDISLAGFAIITSGLVFISAIIYYAIMNTLKLPNQQIREKRTTKYSKKTLINKGIAASIIGLIIIFFAGMLPIYPVIILTESMTGTFNRSSLVFVEKITPNEVLYRIDEGDVIHFISHTGVEYIHRIVEITYDSYGEREYITQGDAAYLVDPFPVPQANVKGIAHSFIPYIGYPIVFFNERR